MSDTTESVGQTGGDTHQASSRRLPAWLVPTITGVSGLLLGAAVVGGIWGVTSLSSAVAHQASAANAEAAQKSILKHAMAACSLSSGADSQLADDGYTLTINGKGEQDFSGISIDDESCLLRSLKAPSAVVSHIDQTTSMDGRQSETWQGITFSWSYHPDRGLDGVFTVQKR